MERYKAEIKEREEMNNTLSSKIFKRTNVENEKKEKNNT